MQAQVFRVVAHPGRAEAFEQHGFSWGMGQEGMAAGERSGEIHPSTSIAASEGEAAVPGVRDRQLRLSGRGQGFIYRILQRTKPQQQLKPTSVRRFA